VTTREEFLLEKDLFERVVRVHLYCDMDVEEIVYALDEEIEEARSILVKEAEELSSLQSSVARSERIWLPLLRNIPVACVGEQERIRIYEEEIRRLAEHCMAQGFVSPDQRFGLVLAIAYHLSILLLEADSTSRENIHRTNLGRYLFVNSG
jgi:hypothetical protein